MMSSRPRPQKPRMLSVFVIAFVLISTLWYLHMSNKYTDDFELRTSLVAKDNQGGERSAVTKSYSTLHREQLNAMKKAREDAVRTAAYKRAVESSGRVVVNEDFFTPNNNNHLSKSDYIYRRDVWDGPPIIVEQYKLMFFAVPKVGCTVFKQLFRRMRGLKDWNQNGKDGLLPHTPGRNGLKYLYDYNIPTAISMLESDEWTRAIFVRDPKDRLISAYLDKAVRADGAYVTQKCCPTCGKESATLAGFLTVMKHCLDPHWMPQSHRMEHRFWETINFVGHIETAAEDTKALLQKLGVWELYGATGWGKAGNESIFESLSNVEHSTKTDTSLIEYFDKKTEALAEEYYKDDFANLRLEFENRQLVN